MVVYILTNVVSEFQGGLYWTISLVVHVDPVDQVLTNLNFLGPLYLAGILLPLFVVLIDWHINDCFSLAFLYHLNFVGLLFALFFVFAVLALGILAFLVLAVVLLIIFNIAEGHPIDLVPLVAVIFYYHRFLMLILLLQTSDMLLTSCVALLLGLVLKGCTLEVVVNALGLHLLLSFGAFTVLGSLARTSYVVLSPEHFFRDT